MVHVSEREAEAVQRATQDQANSKQWFNFRSGRITASRMKAVCATDLTNPSQSLVKAVCYPDSKLFCNSATKWGCDHEKVAREKFLDKINSFHENISVEDSGLVINTDKPYIAASPDGIVSCDCCGKSCLEIKCPFCVRDKELDDFAAPNYLKRAEDGRIKLDTKHSYCYQIQTQMGVTGLEASYFVVWTECDIHIERILFDTILWKDMCEKSFQFFQLAILPELVGKFYSRLPTGNTVLSEINHQLSCTTNSVTTSTDSDEETWCYCGQVESGKMICCDSENCKIIWFHYKCLKITCAPKGKWFCPDCRKIRALGKKRVAKPCQ